MKRILPFILISCIFIAGCSTEKNKRIKSLKDAYFYIVEKNEDKEFKIADIKELLKDYDIEEKDQTESGCKMYIFGKNENEKLSVSVETAQNESIQNVTYNVIQNNKDREVVSNVSLNYDISGGFNKFGINCDTNSIDIFKSLSNEIDDKGSLFLKVYNKVVEDIFAKNDLTLKKIKEEINTEPLVKNYTENFGDNNKFEITRNRYTNKNEDITINYIDKEKKVGRTIYAKLDKDGNPLLTKIAYIKNITDKNPNLSIGSYTQNAKDQEKLLNQVIKK